MPENIKFKRTVNTILPGCLKSKGLQVSAAIKGLPGSEKIKVLLGSTTDIFKVLSEYNNKKIARIVLQSKVLPGSATNKSKFTDVR